MVSLLRVVRSSVSRPSVRPIRCGLCNYDGVVEPGPASELHSVDGLGVSSARPTTFATTVAVVEGDIVDDDGMFSADDASSGGEAANGVIIASGSDSSDDSR